MVMVFPVPQTDNFMIFNDNDQGHRPVVDWRYQPCCEGSLETFWSLENSFMLWSLPYLFLRDVMQNILRNCMESKRGKKKKG